MAGRGRGTALGPDDRDNIRVQLDVLRATARNSKFRRHTRLRLLASTQAGPARGATGHPRHARRGERRAPGPHRDGRPGAAGDGPAPRGHRGRAAGGERGLRSCGACNGAPHFARNGACDGARDGARNGACDGAATTQPRDQGTSGPATRPGTDRDGTATATRPAPLAVARAPGPTPSRLDTSRGAVGAAHRYDPLLRGLGPYIQQTVAALRFSISSDSERPRRDGVVRVRAAAGRARVPASSHGDAMAFES